MDKLHVVKVGGTILNDAELLNRFLNAFAAIEGSKILVHGGGKNATELSKKLSIETKMLNGRRITDSATLEVVVMVYAGLINTNLVAQLQSRGVNALGLSGADLNIIHAHKRNHPTIDYGLVGDIQQVDGGKLQDLVDLGITPVLCPITSDKSGQLLNTNADTIATETAKAMNTQYQVTLKYCFEYPGVMRDIAKDNLPINHLNRTLYDKLKSDGKVYSGMLPKIDNAFSALEAGVQKVAICGINNLTNEKDLTWIV